MQRMLSYPGKFARLSIICVSSKCGLQELGLWGSDRQFQSFRWVVFWEWPCIPKIVFQKCGLSHLCKAFSKVTTKQQRRHPGAFLVLIWSLIYCAGFLIVSAHLVQVRSDISEKLFAVFFLSNFYCLLSDFLTNHVTLSSLFYVSRKSRDIQAVIFTTHNSFFSFYPLFDVSQKPRGFLLVILTFQNSFFILHIFWYVSKITWHFTRYLMCLKTHLALYPLFDVS